VALFGYPHVERVSNGVHDPLCLTVVAIDNGADRVLVGALDVLFLEPPVARRLRSVAAAAARIPEDRVFIGCTHTHSGPVTSRLIAFGSDSAVPPPDPAYLDTLVAAAGEAAAQAVSNMKDAEVAATSADARGVGGNRLRADGITDSECGVVAFRAKGTSELMATILVYGMHPTVLHEDSRLISSDFPHYTRQSLKERFGSDVAVVYLNGPCGDQSPRHFVRSQTFTEAERLGRMLGASVADAIAGLPVDAWGGAPILGGSIAPVTLRRRALRSVADAKALVRVTRERHASLKKAGGSRADIRTAECAVFGAEGTLALAAAEEDGTLSRLIADYQPLEVQAVRIGEICLVGLPGECFVEYGLTIKRDAAMKTFVVSLVNGELQGYIVTPEADREGGYEAANSVFAPASGGTVVEAGLSAVRRLQGGIDNK
jgi:hypothetical protein